MLIDSGCSMLMVDPEWWPNVEPTCNSLSIEHYIGYHDPLKVRTSRQFPALLTMAKRYRRPGWN